MLVDHLGRPALYTPATSGIYEDTQQHSLRVNRPTLDYDFALMLSRTKFRAMLSDARWIYTTFPLVRGASRQKAQYVSANGWTPRHAGEDPDYEGRAWRPLQAALGRSTNRGWSFARAWEMASMALDYDGGLFMLHHLDAQGFPLTQFVEAHRVGSRDLSRQVRGGAYDGATIINGIIYSDSGAELAYNVMGATPEEDRQIPVGQMYHIADYEFFSENRPFPAVAYSILDWYDVKETRNYQKISNKANSAISIIETNETGMSLNANPVPTGNPAVSPEYSDSNLRTETLEGGLIRYFKAGSGSGLTAHTTTSPAEGWRAFDQTVVNGAFYGMGWRSEMMDLSRLTGAGVRGFADNINQVIRSRHATLARFAMIDLQFKVAALTARGDLPQHPEWDLWRFPSPGRFDVDRGRTSSAELDEARAGRKSMAKLIELDGDDAEDVLEQQARYLAARRRIAAKYDLQPEELGTLSKPGDLPAGGSAQDQPQPAAAAEDNA